MKVAILVIALILILVIVYLFFSPRNQVAPNMQKITLKTSDGLDIAADYYASKNAKAVGILLHMMPATKESYQGLAQKLNQIGFAALAIDLRGHGESSGGSNGYLNFSDQDHQKSILDVQAASDYLKTQGFDLSQQFLIGASIGANLALEFLSQNQQVKTAILLSAGLNYRGIQTLPLVKKLMPGQSVFFSASQNDQRSGGNAVEMAQNLYKSLPKGVTGKVITYQNAGHGTDMLSLALGGINQEQQDLAGEIENWLKRIYK